ncbi:MAG: serine acetyltransferase [Austwickia sp.]|nr:serine acetyltransferase [Austwickia sp.]MBK9102901.1 serine acetyltransferase [Austwickia sp.]
MVAMTGSFREYRSIGITRSIIMILNAPRFLPIFALLSISGRRGVIAQDLARWMAVRRLEFTEGFALRYLFTFVPEFRTLVYWRLGKPGRSLEFLARGRVGLNLLMDPLRVGPGLYLQHGDGAFVSCESIGRNCWVSQQVTLGYTNDNDRPTVGDNVSFRAGAKVLGAVYVGDGSTVGANAVVLRNVPPGSVISPPSSRTVVGGAQHKVSK